MKTRRHEVCFAISPLFVSSCLPVKVTTRGVFYLREGGASFRMLDEGADDLQIRDEELFVLFRDAGVLRGSPVSAFAAVGRRS